MALMLVNRQSSSLVVGKPTSQKRAKARSRMPRNHSGCRWARVPNALNASR